MAFYQISDLEFFSTESDPFFCDASGFGDWSILFKLVLNGPRSVVSYFNFNPSGNFLEFVY